MLKVSTMFFRLAGVRLTFSIKLPPVRRLPHTAANTHNCHFILYLVSLCYATLSLSKKISFFCQIVLAIHDIICYYINCLRCKRPVCYDSKEVQRMAKCEFCDKGVSFGIKVSHSHRRSNRPWKPNVKRVKAVINGTPRHVYVCTRCLRSGKVTRAI